MLLQQPQLSPQVPVAISGDYLVRAGVVKFGALSRVCPDDCGQFIDKAVTRRLAVFPSHVVYLGFSGITSSSMP